MKVLSFAETFVWVIPLGRTDRTIHNVGRDGGVGGVGASEGIWIQVLQVDGVLIVILCVRLDHLVWYDLYVIW